MKWLGYIAIPTDLFLSNGHYLYLLSSAEDEWYFSDVCQSARIVLWIFVALFWIKNGNSLTEKLTLAWYGMCAIWDIVQTICKSNGTNPTSEIIIFIAGAIIIQIYFFNGSKSQEKGVHGDK